jgi:hypothetical protein
MCLLSNNLKNIIVFLAIEALFSCENFWGKNHVALFVVIWQKLSNHGLTGLKRFVSTFTDKLCN